MLNGKGRLHTIEGNEHSFAVGRESLWSGRDSAVNHLGCFDAVLNTLLPELRPLDFVFVEGAKSGKDEADYAEKLAGHLAPGSVVDYGNVHLSSGMSTGWESIRYRPEVEVSLRLGRFGLAQIKEEPWILHGHLVAGARYADSAVRTGVPTERAPALDFTGRAYPKFAPRRPQRVGCTPRT